MRRLIVAITGATGAIYGVQLLRHLRTLGVETHLLLSPAGVLNVHQELDLKRADVEALADVVHSVGDVGAALASGSFKTDGMVIAPCSMKTLAAVAHGYADNLISRAADVCLKERRRLVLLPREAPLNLAHIRNMEAVTLWAASFFRRCRRFISGRKASNKWSITRWRACSICWTSSINWRRVGTGRSAPIRSAPRASSGGTLLGPWLVCR